MPIFLKGNEWINSDAWERSLTLESDRFCDFKKVT